MKVLLRFSLLALLLCGAIAGFASNTSNTSSTSSMHLPGAPLPQPPAK